MMVRIQFERSDQIWQMGIKVNIIPSLRDMPIWYAFDSANDWESIRPKEKFTHHASTDQFNRGS